MYKFNINLFDIDRLYKYNFKIGRDKMKAIIFDMDGTLIDSMWIWKDFASNYLQTIGIEPPKDLSESVKHYSLLEASHYLKERFNIDNSPEEINLQAERLLEGYYENEFQLKPYVRETLEELSRRDIKMCIATATEDRLAMATMKRLEIEHYFEFLQTCNSTGLQKGDKRFFEIAVEKLGEKPEDIWVFEDAYHCMQSAKNAKLNVVAVEDESAKEDRDKIKDLADIYITNFKELELDKMKNID